MFRIAAPMMALVAHFVTADAARAQQGHDHAPTPVVEIAGGGEARVPLTFSGPRPVVQIKINGKGPYRFYFDTGASGAVMSQKLADELGLKQIGIAQVNSGGDGPDQKPIEAQIVRLDDVDLSGVKLSNVWIVAMDRIQLGDANAPVGVLSPNLFKGHLEDRGYLMAIDYAKKEVRFRQGSLDEPDNKTVFAYRPRQPIPSLMVRVDGKEIDAQLDTGSGGGLSAPNRMIDTLPLDGSLAESKRKARTVRGEFPVREGKLKGTLEVGQFRFENPTIEFSEAVRNVNLGSQFLERFVVTLDVAKRRFRLEEGKQNAGDDDKPKPRDRERLAAEAIQKSLGVEFAVLESKLLRSITSTKTPYGFKVRDVERDSLAANAGWKPGDVLLEWRGRPIRQLEDLDSAMQKAPVTEAAQFKLARHRKDASALSRQPWEYIHGTIHPK